MVGRYTFSVKTERSDETVMPLGIIGASVPVWKYANLGTPK